MENDDEFTSAGTSLARLKASANAAATSQLSMAHNIEDIIDILGPSSTDTKKNGKDAKGPSPPKIRKVLKELDEEEEEKDEPEVLSSDAEVDSSQDTLQVMDDSLLTSDDDDVITNHHRKNAKEHTNRAAFFRRREMISTLDEHKHILTYLDGTKQKESEVSPGKGGDFSSEVTVKVRWNLGVVQKHQVRRLQPLRALFEEYAAKEGVSLDMVVFELREQRVSPDETPDALGLTVATILSGYKVAHKVDATTRSEDDEQMLDIKVQVKDRRADKINVRLRPLEPMAKAFCAVAEALGVDASDVRLLFDGERVYPTQTAEELELEGGEVFDCVLGSDFMPTDKKD